MYDYTFTIEMVSTGTPAVDFFLAVLVLFVIYWAIKFIWSIVVGG